MLTLDEKTVGLWFIELDDSSDFMAMLACTDNDHAWEFVYRFRYYLDDKAFDSADKKSWYRATIEAPDEKTVILRTRAAITAVAGLAQGRHYECLRGGKTPVQFFAELRKLPFIHVQKHHRH
jgi:hypothetical protein